MRSNQRSSPLCDLVNASRQCEEGLLTVPPNFCFTSYISMFRNQFSGSTNQTDRTASYLYESCSSFCINFLILVTRLTARLDTY